jgi:hypothetical protein
MISEMRELPPDVVKAWDSGNEEEPRYVAGMRAARQLLAAKARFIFMLWAVGGLVAGLLVGGLAVPTVWAALVGASLIAIAVQGLVWLRCYVVGMQVSQKIDSSIKIIEPRIKEAAKEGV